MILRVVEPNPEDELSITSPTMNPNAVNLGVPTVNVTFHTKVFGTKNSPYLLTLEEIDKNGNLIKVLGTLNDIGINSDDTAGDFRYSGIFTLNANVESKTFYQTTAIHNGELVVSKIDSFTVTHFPIGHLLRLHLLLNIQ